MAEATKIEYTNKQLLELMLKDQNIHEGNWILTVRFLQSAINFGQSQDGIDVAPASISIINAIGIEHVKEPLPFSLDASVINPKKTKSISRKKS